MRSVYSINIIGKKPRFVNTCGAKKVPFRLSIEFLLAFYEKTDGFTRYFPKNGAFYF